MFQSAFLAHQGGQKIENRSNYHTFGPGPAKRASYCRVADRNFSGPPAYRNGSLGFRLARTP